MILSHYSAFVVYLLSLCGDSDTTELSVTESPLPLTLASSCRSLSLRQMKNITTNQQEGVRRIQPAEYLEVKLNTRYLNNLLFKTKDFEVDLNSCMKNPTASCLIRKAYIAASNITNVSRRDFSFVFVVEAQTAFGDIDGALTTIARIENSSLRLPARLAVAKEYVARRNLSEAIKITNEVLQNISTIQIAYIRTWVLALSASVFAEMGDVRNAHLNIRKALQGMPKIKDNSTRAEMYSLIAYAQGSSNDLKGATKSIADAFAEIDKTDDPFLSALALTFVARAQARLGQNENYKRSISLVLTKASALRVGPRALVLSFASSTQAEVGDKHGARVTIEPAINTTKMLYDDHSRAPALAFIGKTFAQMASP